MGKYTGNEERHYRMVKDSIRKEEGRSMQRKQCNVSTGAEKFGMC